MSLLRINVGGELASFIMSSDIEEIIIPRLKERYLIPFLQAIRTEVAAISDEGTEYQCVKYLIKLDESEKDDIMDNAGRIMRENIEKSIPEISKS